MFNKEELTVLKQLLDMATKAYGIQVAEACVVLNKKIDSILNSDEQVLEAKPE